MFFKTNRDFTPGYVKTVSYCCGKCAERMTCHEALMMETTSPFQSYKKLDFGGRDSEMSTLSDNFHQTLDPQLSEITLDDLRQQRVRLWGFKEKTPSSLDTTNNETVIEAWGQNEYPQLVSTNDDTEVNKHTIERSKDNSLDKEQKGILKSKSAFFRCL